MMLSFRRPFIRRPVAKTPTQATAPADATLCKIDDAATPHVDYDLQPLNIGEFEHYIEPGTEDERFRVH